MKYEKQLRQLISNLLEEHRCTTDYLISCPKPDCGTQMEFGHYKPHAWFCLSKSCGFTISGEELPGPDKIERLIKEVESEKGIEEIKNIIREIIQKEPV